jgi:hypothetical protein
MPVHDFHLRPSRLYFFIFAVIVLVSCLILTSLPVPLWLKLVGMTAVLVHGSRVFWRYVLLRDRLSITAIKYLDEKRWVIQNRDGTFAAELHPSSTVSSVVMLLHFRIAGKMLPLKSVVFRDSIAVDDYRQLLVVLNR